MSPELIAGLLILFAVIRASSRDIGGLWLNADGTRQSWQHSGGHFACIRRHRDGLFYMKDSSGPSRLHNDVPYSRGKMVAWLAGAFENRYVIRVV